MTHRYYDPQTGRFLTRDPIGYAAGVNLYGYVGIDTVYWIDPLGHKKNEKKKKKRRSFREWASDQWSAFSGFLGLGGDDVVSAAAGAATKNPAIGGAAGPLIGGACAIATYEENKNKINDIMTGWHDKNRREGTDDLTDGIYTKGPVSLRTGGGKNNKRKR